MRVGVVGGGQLAQMLAQAAVNLGAQVVCLEPTLHCPAAQVVKVIEGAYNDSDALSKLVSLSDVLSYEFENVSPDALAPFESRLPIYPPIDALRKTQDRFVEKSFLNSLAIPTAPFKAVNSLAELKTAVEALGFPAVLKTRRGGYDGKGQWILKSEKDFDEVEKVLAETPCILEAWIGFKRELSLIAVRSTVGEMAFYPLVENKHEAGILRISQAPFMDQALQTQAEMYLRTLLSSLNYVGVICVEFFQQDEQLIANEIAPRVHNSGHWTIEGAKTSQFENHLRAILGMPLGATTAKGFSWMMNIIGEMPSEQKTGPGIYWHVYGKEERPLRKLAHLTIVSDTEENLHKIQQKLIAK